MSLPWFRMYSEFATDPVVQSLSFDDQRHFVMVLCLKCAGVLDKRFPTPEMRETILKRSLGLDAIAFIETLKRLETVGLVSSDWQPKNWKKRQFVSDSSTKRVQAFRKRFSNVAVTPSDTDTDTDTDTERTKREGKRASRSSRVPPDFSPDLSIALPDMDGPAEAQKFRDWEFKTPRSDWAAAWRNWIARCKETGRYVRKPKGDEMYIDGEKVVWR